MRIALESLFLYKSKSENTIWFSVAANCSILEDDPDDKSENYQALKIFMIFCTPRKVKKENLQY